MQSFDRRKCGADNRPVLTIRAGTVYQREPVLVAGEGWPLDAVRFHIGKQEVWPSRIRQGSVWNGSVVPDRDGAFLVEFSTRGSKPGRRVLRAEPYDGAFEVEARIRIVARTEPGPDVPREEIDKPEQRGEAFAVRIIGE